MGGEIRPLRVLHLIPDFGKGGAERFLIDLATELGRRDDVEIVVGSLYERDQYGPLTANLPIEHLDFQAFSLRGENGCPAYAALLERFRPDVVHTHLFLAEFLSSYYVSPNTAYVCHGHDNMIQFEGPSVHTLSSRHALTNFLERSLLIRHKYRKVPTAFIANSSHTRDYYRRVLPRRMKNDVVVIPYGFDYNRFFTPEVEPPNLSQRVRLLNVGSFQPKKNQIFIVEIARELLASGLDFEIVLLGDGPTRENVKATIQAAGLEQHFVLPGNVQAVEAWMRRSHLYIHTAIYEPFGLVYLEAMAAGLPCVTLDGMGNRDVIVEGQNGFLLERQDARSFADRVLELLADREQYREISAYAQRFAKRYDIDAATDRFVEFYRARVELVRGGQGGRVNLPRDVRCEIGADSTHRRLDSS